MRNMEHTSFEVKGVQEIEKALEEAVEATASVGNSQVSVKTEEVVEVTGGNQ